MIAFNWEFLSFLPTAFLLKKSEIHEKEV